MARDDEKIAAFRRIRDDVKKWIFDSFANLKVEDLNSPPHENLLHNVTHK